MTTSDPVPRSLLPLLTLALAVAITGCAEGGGSSDGSARPEGAVGVLLTDAPADPSLFSEITLRVDRIEVVGEGSLEDQVLYEGEGREIDLLDLRTHSLPLGLHRAVPAGRYCRLRLHVERIELVLVSGERALADRPGNSGRIEIVPRECLEVVDGEIVLLQLDVDAGRSIHIVEAPPGSRRFLFRPVIHADLLSSAFAEKVVRVDGTLAEIDADSGELLVCDVIPVVGTGELPAYRGCVTARVRRDTAFFDNVEREGEPRPLADLFDEFWIGETIGFVGRVDPRVAPRRAVRVPPGHYPPSGACKIWYPGRPPGHQPPPTRCTIDPEDVPDRAVLIDASGRPVIDRQGLLEIDALVVQLGDSLRLTGVVDAAVMDDVLPVLLDSGQPVARDVPIDVLLQAAPMGGNGTRILTTTGVPLEVAEVFAGDPITVDGVLVVDDPDFVRAALVLVDVERAGEALASGEVVEIREGGFVIDLESNPCRTGGSLDVLTDDETREVSVTITDEGSLTSVGVGLELDDQVSVTGWCETDALLASVVLRIDDQRAIGGE